jgi:hypothetical protein
LRKFGQVQQQSATIATFFKPRRSDGTIGRVTLKSVQEEILKFFVSGNISFLQANNVHFRNLMNWISVADAQNVSISRRQIRTLLSNHALTAAEELKSIFSDGDSKISLALDAWSSRNGHAFLGITGHVPIRRCDFALHISFRQSLTCSRDCALD